MADDQNQAENAGEAKEGEAMPTSQPEQTGTQEDVGETQETLETPAGGSEGELPDGVSERTRNEFDKLKTQLREYRQRLFNEQQYRETVGEQKPLYDEKTGLINVEALTDLQKKALEAERRVKALEQGVQAQTQDAQVRELYEAHPEFQNPKNKEHKELFDESERIWMHSQAYPEKYGGMALTQKQAADLAKKRMGTTVKTEAKEEAQNVESKEQASLTVSGRPTQGVQTKITSEEEIQKLQFGTRIGDKDAMIARMRAIREASETK